MNLVQMVTDISPPPIGILRGMHASEVVQGGGRRSKSLFLDEDRYPGLLAWANSLVRLENHKYRYILEELPVIQYTEYKQGDYYFPHTDQPLRDIIGHNRKLSFSIILNPSEFTGGELQFLQDPGLPEAPKNSPYAVFFPSYVMHGVAEVKTGVRKSLVGWVTGPSFV